MQRIADVALTFGNGGLLPGFDIGLALGELCGSVLGLILAALEPFEIGATFSDPDVALAMFMKI